MTRARFPHNGHGETVTVTGEVVLTGITHARVTSWDDVFGGVAIVDDDPWTWGSG